MRDRPALDLFLISWLVLFLELACIRWFPSHVLFLTFFTNTVLLACFVGMSVGCLVARRPGRHIRYTPYLLLVGGLRGVARAIAYSDDLRDIFAVGDQAKGDVVYFGTEAIAVRAAAVHHPDRVRRGRSSSSLIAAVMVGPRPGDGAGVQSRRRTARRRTRRTCSAASSASACSRRARTCGCRRSSGSARAALVMIYLLVRDDPDAPRPFPARRSRVRSCRW